MYKTHLPARSQF